jgi:hypothetical protein
MKIIKLTQKLIKGVAALIGYSFAAVPVYGFLGLASANKELKDDAGIDVIGSIKSGIDWLIEDDDQPKPKKKRG